MWEPLMLKYENGRILAEIKPSGKKFEACVAIQPFDCKGGNMVLSSSEFIDVDSAKDWVSNIFHVWSSAFAEASKATKV
jgi:hypothetical protein